MQSVIIQALKDKSADDFVAHHLFDQLPYVFPEKKDFVEWKKIVSKAIDVDAAAITIVGSAAIGVSLNPHKNFREFNGKSDIDVAVISPLHFNIAWRFLRQNKNMRYRLTPVQRSAWEQHERGLLYYGAIATDKLLGLMPFGGSWLQASVAASRPAYIADRQVLFRIYYDFDSLRSYQVRSVKAVQPAALTQ